LAYSNLCLTTVLASHRLTDRLAQLRAYRLKNRVLAGAKRFGKLGHGTRCRVISAALDQRHVALRQPGARSEAGLRQASPKAQAAEGVRFIANQTAKLTPRACESVGHLRVLLELGY